MNANEAFAKILDEDENIVESFKPNRTRFIGLGIIRDILVSIPVFIFIAIFLIIGSCDFEVDTCEINGVEQTGEACTEAFGIFSIIGYIALGLFVLGVFFSIFSRFVRFNKTWYCYTNKRILIRSGFIGADYQTLDFDMIGAMNVRVDLLDKIIHPNTGTVWFASAASPMISGGVPGGVSGYAFASIENPYEVYKRVKEYSSKNKDGKLNS